jgi:hypothetical protein
MSFEEYCISKKIDAQAFSANERYSELKALFEQISPNSFTQQKLFIINEIRRQYPLQEQKAN